MAFDLDKTAKMHEMVKVPLNGRDAAWIARFFAIAPDASLKTREDQVVKGPDGFPYFALYLPDMGERFESFSVSHVLDVCTENGFGIVIGPDKMPPHWVFTYGHLWSYKLWGLFDATTAANAQRPAAQTGAKVLMGSPEERLLPTWARPVLKSYLQHLGVEAPTVALIANPAATPVQSLTFNFQPEHVGGSTELFQAQMNRLRWFIPPHLGLVHLPPDPQHAPLFMEL